jgi:hypothetical protein
MTPINFESLQIDRRAIRPYLCVFLLRVFRRVFADAVHDAGGDGAGDDDDDFADTELVGRGEWW